jgi:hypothetical protein
MFDSKVLAKASSQMRKQMKTALLALAAIGCIVTTTHAQAKSQCQRDYVEAVKGCAMGLSVLAPSIKAAAQAACVHEAQATRNQCETPGTCNTNCETAYTNQVNNVCPANCGTDSICLDVCNANAMNTYTSCIAACP